MQSVAKERAIKGRMQVGKIVGRLLVSFMLANTWTLSYSEHASFVNASDLSIDIPTLQVGNDFYQVLLSYEAPAWIVSEAVPILPGEPAGIYANDEISLPCISYLGETYSVTLELSPSETNEIRFDLGVVTANPGCNSHQNSSPNILLIMADDMGIEAATECYPNLISDTMDKYSALSNFNDIDGNSASIPNITNKICAQGMIFDNVWAQPSCSPTRATIITGLYGYKNNVLYPLSDDVVDESFLLPHQIMLPEYLTDNGYAAAAFGKWHLGEEDSNATPVELGFDFYRGKISGKFEYDNYDYSVQGNDADNPFMLTQIDQPSATLTIDTVEGAVEINTTYAPVIKVVDTMDWIETKNVSDPDQPWFIWLSLNTPHTPLHSPDQVYLNQITRDDLAACSDNCDAAQYRSMVNAMDTILGSLLDFIFDDDPNTLVIFLGDNGSVRSVIDNLYLTTNGRGKGSVYESGLRVPMAVVGPDVVAGSISSEFIHTADLFATIIDLAGLSVPSWNYDRSDPSLNTIVDSDSVSFASIIRGQAATVKDPVNDYILSEISTSANPNLDAVAARNATYKLVCRLGGCDAPQFFNLIDDPLEEFPLNTGFSCLSPNGALQEAYCMLEDSILNRSHYQN